MGRLWPEESGELKRQGGEVKNTGDWEEGEVESKRILCLCSESEAPIVEENAKELEPYLVEVETAETVFSLGISKYLSEMIDLINQDPTRYHGVVGTRDLTAVFAIVISAKTGKTSASVEGLINCQNKYISRKKQQEVAPECVPYFGLDSDFLWDFPLPPPFFVKPVRGNVSYQSWMCFSYDSLRRIISENTAELSQYNHYYLESLKIGSHLDHQLNLETCNKFLCEAIIPGMQLTINGYVWKGQVQWLGMVKAEFLSDGLSFSHHEYPFQLPPEEEARLMELVKKLVEALELDNTCFNVEVRLDPGQREIKIIEVNCRAAFQFIRTIEAVTGCNLLLWMCQLAAGDAPSWKPVRHKKPLYPLCFNFELREEEDREVLRIPTGTDLAGLEKDFPEVTVKNLVQPNTRLSHYKQNPKSYRYCILDVPGNSKEEILAKMREVKSRLGYEFSS